MQMCSVSVPKPVCSGSFSLGHSVAKSFATENKNEHFFIGQVHVLPPCFSPFFLCSVPNEYDPGPYGEEQQQNSPWSPQGSLTQTPGR